MLNIFNFFKNACRFLLSYLLDKKNIIILIEEKGVFLCAFVHNKAVDSLFIALEDQENLDLYKEFFQKFKKFYVFFLLNNSDCRLRHEVVPVLHSLVKANPVEKFIEEYFLQDNIVGYNVYSVTTKPSEVWNTLIAFTNYTPFLRKLIDYVISTNYLKFGGIYFLTLELKAIIDKALIQLGHEGYAEYFQIFIFILKSGGIKLVVKHAENIISIQNLEYPTGKSDLYIQGIIEQEIEDCLIESQHYIDNSGLKVCIIIIAGENLKSLLTNSKFSKHPVMCASLNTLLGKYSTENDNFADKLVVKLFNKHKNLPAYNRDLKIISKLNVVNSFVFKPLMLVIITLIISIIAIKVKTLENYKKLVILNSHYSSTEQEYYDVKKKYPYIQNATNLADLYIFEALLQIPIPIPFDLLENFVRSLPPNLVLEGMKWSRLDLNNTLLSPNQYTETEIFLKFIIEHTSIEDSIKILKQQISAYTKIFGNVEINLTIFNDQIVNLSHRIVIPVSLIITKQ